MSTDFQGTFQKKFHAKVIPGLLLILDDHENPRTQAHGGAALVNFSEDCPARLLVEHLPQIIEKLEQVLSRKYQEVICKFRLFHWLIFLFAVARSSQSKVGLRTNRHHPGGHCWYCRKRILPVLWSIYASTEISVQECRFTGLSNATREDDGMYQFDWLSGRQGKGLLRHFPERYFIEFV